MLGDEPTDLFFGDVALDDDDKDLVLEETVRDDNPRDERLPFDALFKSNCGNNGTVAPEERPLFVLDDDDVEYMLLVLLPLFDLLRGVYCFVCFFIFFFGVL